MRRREFITLIGGAAAAWPLAARAQQPDRVRRIGLLVASVETDPIGQERVEAFRRGLREFGWVEGRNLEKNSVAVVWRRCCSAWGLAAMNVCGDIGRGQVAEIGGDLDGGRRDSRRGASKNSSRLGR